MTKDIYIWSDNKKDSAVSYYIVDEEGTKKFYKLDVKSVAKVVNGLKSQGYSIHIDCNWIGAEMKIPSEVRSKLLKLIKMEESQIV